MLDNGKRALAHIEKIEWIKPIENADRIELVGVLGWQCIAKKGEFNVGDLAVYIEIDSRVPEWDEFEFMRNKDFKVKTMKMRGVISQGLALPVSVFKCIHNAAVGMNVTDTLEITKIITSEERRLMAEERASENAAMTRAKHRHPRLMKSFIVRKMMKKDWSRRLVLRLLGCKVEKPLAFPSWIEKTDEERIQNMPEILTMKDPIYFTEKVDGTSTTFGVKKKGKKRYEFVVCSRNVRQKTMKQNTFNTEEAGGNVYWEMAMKHNVEKVLTDIARKVNAETVVLQGETIGLGLQGNPYRLLDHRFYGYNLIINGKRMNSESAKKTMSEYGIEWVPILGVITLPDTVAELLNFAEGNSVIPTGDGKVVDREGLVFRSLDGGSVSFKAVSNSFLMRKHPDVLAKDIQNKKF